MSWQTWEKEWKIPSRQKRPSNGGNRDKHKKEGKEDFVMVGFNGKKLPYSLQLDGAASSSNAANSEVQELKNMVRTLSKGGQLTSEQERRLDGDPREELCEKQKQLNQQRKHMNKIRSLETKLQANKEKLDAWLQQQRYLVAQEKSRFEAEQAAIQKELTMPQEGDNPMEEEFEDLLEQDLPMESAAEKRILQAERQAADAQQALMVMQNQLQQWFAYQQAAAAVPLPAHAVPAAPAVPEEQSAPATAPTPTPGAVSAPSCQRVRGKITWTRERNSIRQRQPCQKEKKSPQKTRRWWKSRTTMQSKAISSQACCIENFAFLLADVINQASWYSSMWKRCQKRPKLSWWKMTRWHSCYAQRTIQQANEMPILGDLPPPLPANEGPQERLRMAGQRNDAAPRAENIIAWRPFRPGFEHLGRPESNMIFLREGNQKTEQKLWTKRSLQSGLTFERFFGSEWTYISIGLMVMLWTIKWNRC